MNVSKALSDKLARLFLVGAVVFSTSALSSNAYASATLMKQATIGSYCITDLHFDPSSDDAYMWGWESSLTPVSDDLQEGCDGWLQADYHSEGWYQDSNNYFSYAPSTVFGPSGEHDDGSGYLAEACSKEGIPGTDNNNFDTFAIGCTSAY
jgi:hypothetical protein